MYLLWLLCEDTLELVRKCINECVLGLGVCSWLHKWWLCYEFVLDFQSPHLVFSEVTLFSDMSNLFQKN